MAQEQEGKAASSGGMVNVKFGIWGGPGKHAGKTVKQLKEELASTTNWGIDNSVKFFKGKTELSDDYIIQDGDSLEAIKKMGEKGN